MDSLFIFGAQYLYILSIIIALVFFWKQPHEVKKQIALCAVIALPLAYLISLGASALYYNPQPFVVGDFTPLIPKEIDNGFPSHHTLLAAAIAAVAFFFNRGVGNILWVIALLVGISRVNVGVHHSIDIIASILIAFFAAWVVDYFVKKKLKATP